MSYKPKKIKGSKIRMAYRGVVIRLCKLIYPSGEVLNGAVQDFPRRGLKKEYLTNNLKKKNGNY
jgi:hypothetical protein